ncbi:unnamed protein product [Plutella xylostella]|uniref:(diamondback moth) hypothetical protein n=1 Tax=Plutella xylostella TaxID=51655 RepID=A0A8S4EV75_PLUXY|nr:unnamed protein product [Plutella xylostella]
MSDQMYYGEIPVNVNNTLAHLDFTQFMGDVEIQDFTMMPGGAERCMNADALGFHDNGVNMNINNNNNSTNINNNNNNEEKTEMPDPDYIKMFVGQVPRSMDENDLRLMFEEFGRVHQINVLRDKVTGASKVTMAGSNVTVAGPCHYNGVVCTLINQLVGFSHVLCALLGVPFR